MDTSFLKKFNNLYLNNQETNNDICGETLSHLSKLHTSCYWMNKNYNAWQTFDSDM